MNKYFKLYFVEAGTTEIEMIYDPEDGECWPAHGYGPFLGSELIHQIRTLPIIFPELELMDVIIEE